MNNGAINGNGNGIKASTPRGQDLGNLLWKIADLLRSNYRPAEYGKVILPFTLLRRMDCVLEATKAEVLKVAAKVRDVDNLRPDEEIRLRRASGYAFFNTSPFDFKRLKADPKGLRKNLEAYIAGFSANVRDVFERYKFDDQIEKLDEKNLLFELVTALAAADLHINVVTNADMGSAFEYLIRKFNELSNETAGDHYTPRDAIHALVDLVVSGDPDLFQNDAPVRMIYDPTAGTGGMLSIAEERIKEYKKSAKVSAYAQEVNDESYAICKADMLIKGQDVSNIRLGNTLSNDQFPDEKFDYMFSNPPYGVDWKQVQKAVSDEHEKKGYKGRFGPGLPRISDGQMLFLLHLVSKMRDPKHGRSRIGIVMNGSPLFSGAAGSGESEIRKFVLENDYVEAIVALPTDMFYNTGIATYLWILTNKKTKDRTGKVQLINAADFYEKMRKSLGSKRRELSTADITRIVKIHDDFDDADLEYSKVLPNEAFGYRTIVVERPLRLNFAVSEDRLARLDDEASLTKNGLSVADIKAALSKIGKDVFMNREAFLKAVDAVLKKAGISLKPPQYKAMIQALSKRDEHADVCTTAKGRPEPDADLRDTENVPLTEDIHAYFEREVKPYAADAWIDESKTKTGYEIPFTRYFYKYAPPRALAEIDTDLKMLTGEITSMLSEVAS